MEEIKVSILVPVYGTEKYISRCAHSLFRQNYQNIEYVFVDDKTPDNSIVVLEKILKDYPNRKDAVRIIHHEINKGISSTRNTALNNAHGDFVIWVDSDDSVSETMVESLVNKQKEEDADIVIGKLEYVYVNSVEHRSFPIVGTPHDYLCLLLRRKTNSGLWAKLWRRSIYVENNISFPDGNNMEEDGYVSAQFLYYAKTIAYADNIVYYYDCTRDGTAASFSVNKYNQAWQVNDMLENFLSEKDELFKNDMIVWKLHLGVNTLTNCAKDGNVKEYFNNIKEKRLKSICRTYWKEIEPLKRFVLYVDSYRLNVLYFRLMSLMKHRVLRKQDFT